MSDLCKGNLICLICAGVPAATDAEREECGGRGHERVTIADAGAGAVSGAGVERKR